MKILFVNEFLRTDFFKGNKFDYWNSKAGKLLKTAITGRRGLELNMDDFRLTFAYPRVPDVLPSGKYKPVTAKQAKPFYEKLHEKILEYQPDLIVSLGNIGLQGVTGKKGVSKVRGVPEKLHFEDKEGKSLDTWIIPTYSIENLFAIPSNQKLFNADFTLIKQYLKEGTKAFTEGAGKYSLIDKFDDVVKIFEFLRTQGTTKDNPIAMDFETNSLDGALQGVQNTNSADSRIMFDGLIDNSDYVRAKPIILSLSWQTGSGVAIPMDYKNHWTAEEYEYIKREVRDLIEGQRWIVGHNFKFDIRFMMDTIELTKATNCMDTMLMYYIGVSEESTASKGLKALAYQYTTMGGYDRDLDAYKKDWKLKAMEIAKEYCEDNGLKFTKTGYQAPKNEVDGGDFDYEWIPLDIIYPYAAGDTDACLRIFKALKEIIDSYDKWQNLAYNFYPQLIDVLCLMEHNGIKLDQDRAKHLSTVYEAEEEKLYQRIRDEIPEVQVYEDERRKKLQEYLDIMSIKASERTPEQKEKQRKLAKYKGTKDDPEKNIRYSPTSRDASKYILYNLMGYKLPASREFLTESALKKQSGFEIDEDKLEWTDYKADGKEALPYLAKEYDAKFAKLLMAYAKINTLNNNFIQKLPRMADPRSLVHTRFIPTGTVTLTKVTN